MGLFQELNVIAQLALEAGNGSGLLGVLQQDLAKIKPDHWKGSIDGVAINGGVQAVDVGTTLQPAIAWARAQFTQDGEQHTVEGNGPLLTFGRVEAEGTYKISLDGVAATKGDEIVLSTRTGFLFAAIVLEFRFVGADGQAHDLRFDGYLVGG